MINKNEINTQNPKEEIIYEAGSVGLQTQEEIWKIKNYQYIKQKFCNNKKNFFNNKFKKYSIKLMKNKETFIIMKAIIQDLIIQLKGVDFFQNIGDINLNCYVMKIKTKKIPGKVILSFFIRKSYINGEILIIQKNIMFKKILSHKIYILKNIKYKAIMNQAAQKFILYKQKFNTIEKYNTIEKHNKKQEQRMLKLNGTSSMIYKNINIILQKYIPSISGFIIQFMNYMMHRKYETEYILWFGELSLQQGYCYKLGLFTLPKDRENCYIAICILNNKQNINLLFLTVIPVFAQKMILQEENLLLKYHKMRNLFKLQRFNGNKNIGKCNSSFFKLPIKCFMNVMDNSHNKSKCATCLMVPLFIIHQ